MRRLLTSLCLAASAVLLVPAAGLAGVNILTNPGFEAGGGSFDTWNAFGSGPSISNSSNDNIFRSDSSAAKVVGEFTNCNPGNGAFTVGGFVQSHTPGAVGQIYEFSGYAFMSSGDPITPDSTGHCEENRVLAKIVYFNAAVGGTEISSNEVTIGDGRTTQLDKWNEFSVSLPVPTGAMRVEVFILYLQPSCFTGALFIDDLSLCERPAVNKPNLLTNPSFSAGLTGWNTFDNVFFEGRNTVVRTPSGCAKLFSSGLVDTPSGMNQSFAASPGSSWEFELYAMTTCLDGDPIVGSNDNFVLAAIVFRDSSGVELEAASTVALNNTQPALGMWDRRVINATAPANTASVEPTVLFISPTLMGGAMWVDDACFRQINTTSVPTTRVNPETIRLHQNMPNPLYASTRISFDLDQPEDVDVSIFDVSGRRVAKLFRGHLRAGTHHVAWDRKNDAGIKVAAGIYHYVLRTPSQVKSKSLMVVN